MNAARGTDEPRAPRSGARLSRLLVGGVLLAGALTGCGGGSGDQKPYQPPDFVPDRAHYVLPLDAYLPDRAEDEYARNLLVQRCMQAAQIPWPIPGLASKSRAPSINPMGRKLFTVELARRYGYHTGPAPTSAETPAPRKLTAAQQRVFGDCAATANKTIGASDDARSLVEALQYAANTSATQSPEVQKLNKAWRACMLKAGVATVPDSPSGVPTKEQRRRWFGAPELADGPATPQVVGGPEEIRFASLDASCRESSGYAQGVYQAEVDAQIKLMGQNQPALERARANTKAASAVIQELLRNQNG